MNRGGSSTAAGAIATAGTLATGRGGSDFPIPNRAPIPIPVVIGQTPVDTINKTARRNAQIQGTYAGLNSFLPALYGRRRMGPLIGKPGFVDGRLILPCFWCHGEVDAYETLEINDDPSGILDSPRVTVTNYYGTQAQTVDPTLLEMYGTGFTDRFPGVAYSVIALSKTHKSSGFPRVNALMRGMKIRPTVAGVRSWSQSTILCLADFIEDTVYGAGMSVNWSDVAACVAFRDAMIGGEVARQLDLALDTSQLAETWIAVLQDYAGVWCVPEGDTYRMIPDVDGAPVAAFDESNMKKVRTKKRAAKNQITCVEITYSDAQETRWKDGTVYAWLPGVKEGTAPRRMSRITKVGTTRKSEATRYAIERLNNSTLGDKSISFVGFDEALSTTGGDLITANHSRWGFAKVFRTQKIEVIEPGRYQITAVEHDPAKYSLEIQTEASTPDTLTYSASDPPQVEDLAAVPVVFQTGDGLLSTRIAITWTIGAYPYVGKYKVEVFKDTVDGEFVAGGDTSSTSFTTGPVAENQVYAIRVTLFSTTGVEGDPATTAILVGTSSTGPSDLASIVGSVSGNVTRLTWAWPEDFDLKACELRWGAPALGTDTAAYSSATLLNRVAYPQTVYETTQLPTGTWRVFAKAKNSERSLAYPNGRESANPVYCDIVILGVAGETPPPAPIVGDDLEPSGVVLVNMTAWDPGGWVTNMHDTWGALFPTTMSTYTNPVASYHTSGTSSLTTTAVDLGFLKKANIVWNPTWEDISGAAIAYIETSPDNSVWTRQAAGLAWNGTTRYVRGCLETLTTGTLWVHTKGRFQAQVDGVAIALDAALNRGLILDTFNVATML